MNAMNSNPAAEALRVGFGETTLGSVLVAKSDKGITAILLGDHQTRLRRELAEPFRMSAS